MSELTEEEKKYLDEKFDTFRKAFWNKFKLPALGLAVLFAGLISIFATYMYMQAKVNVMESQAELTQAKTSFYEGMMAANKEIRALVDSYNELVEEAGASVEKMNVYKEELEKIAKRHTELKNMRPAGHPPESRPAIELPDPAEPPHAITPPPPMPPPSPEPKERTKDIFKIPDIIQQRMAPQQQMLQ